MEGMPGRILHISKDNAYVDKVLFSQETYAIGMSRTAPTHLFRGTIEYAIDYSKPLQPGDPDPTLGGNGSWTMVRNWSVGAEGAHGSEPAKYSTLGPHTGILYAERLSNGRFYGHIRDAKSRSVREVEFPESGTAPIRFTEWKSDHEIPMQTDGSLLKFSTSGSVPRKKITIQRSELTGLMVLAIRFVKPTPRLRVLIMTRLWSQG